MELTDVKGELARIASDLADTPAGVHWVNVRATFAAEHPDALAAMSEQVGWDYLGRLAGEAIKPLRAKSAQLALPGIDEIPATVTVPDGEGSFAVKTLRWASEADLVADRRIHDENVAGAIAARDSAERRNRILIPIMEEHGFATAGEAIEFLTGQ